MRMYREGKNEKPLNGHYIEQLTTLLTSKQNVVFFFIYLKNWFKTKLLRFIFRHFFSD